ncbi:hypothetical protein JW756_01820 [Candidatus Woesearchaeota archaeon]|nr:hypothetical protein [Candidatus Woesearchaeota archaeon]
MTVVSDLQTTAIGYAFISLKNKSHKINHEALDKDQFEYLEQKRKECPALDKVIRKELSPVEKIDDIVKKYKGIRNYLPVFPDKKHDSKVREISDLLSYELLNTMPHHKNPIKNAFSSVVDLIVNPLGTGLLGAGLTSYFLPHKVTNVSSLRYLVGVVVISLIMSLFGFYSSSIRKEEIKKAKEDAQYLENTINRLYYDKR